MADYKPSKDGGSVLVVGDLSGVSVNTFTFASPGVLVFIISRFGFIPAEAGHLIYLSCQVLKVSFAVLAPVSPYSLSNGSI